MTTRYKLTIEYDGSSYCGFQKQFGISEKSVEEVLEEAVFKMSQEHPKIMVCGRTDAGVHALGQVVHFDLEKKFSEHQIILGLNSYLREENVVILNCELVDENFHARFNAKMRHYRYVIVNRRAPMVLQRNRAWHVAQKLDIEAMRQSAKFLIGEHDFSSFRDAECQGKSPVKTIERIEITQNGEEIFIEVSAKSFLHHMVRNIVGTLVWVGSGKIEALEMKKILEARNRTKSGPNAPAVGLYFLRVDY
ncbi:MAG: tRNA pseudouridine(38-40) synthase TruA [Rickettsiales bacterium]|nr:tRNA pseudouridine(38-40) synthase TruA [Rickettsiales bacterium]